MKVYWTIACFMVFLLIFLFYDDHCRTQAIIKRDEEVKEYVRTHGMVEAFEIVFVPIHRVIKPHYRIVWLRFTDGTERKVYLHEFFEFTEAGRFEKVEVSQ